MNSKNKFILFILFLAVSIIFAIISGYLGVDPTSIKNFVTINHAFASVIYTLIFGVLASFSSSISVMISLGALLFLWYEVLAYAMIGIMISAILHYYIAKKLGRGYIRDYISKHGGRIEKFDELIEKNTFKTIFILSAVFFVPPLIPNLLGGVININLRKYFMATFLGNLPNTFFTIWLVNGLLYSNSLQVYASIIGMVATTLIALYFSKGEISHIVKLSFPKIFRWERKHILNEDKSDVLEGSKT